MNVPTTLLLHFHHCLFLSLYSLQDSRIDLEFVPRMHCSAAGTVGLLVCYIGELISRIHIYYNSQF